jgi:Phosphate-selective porin O and P
VPFTLGESVSSNDIPLVERAAIVNVATNIFANDFRSALGVRWYTERYWAGLYLTGPQSGATHNTGEQIGIFGDIGIYRAFTRFNSAREGARISLRPTFAPRRQACFSRMRLISWGCERHDDHQ